MMLFLTKNGISLDVADALAGYELEGWYNILMNIEKDKLTALAKIVMGARF